MVWDWSELQSNKMPLIGRHILNTTQACHKKSALEWRQRKTNNSTVPWKSKVSAERVRRAVLSRAHCFLYFVVRFLWSQRHFLDEKYQSQKRRCHWDRSPAIRFAHGAISFEWWTVTRFSCKSIWWRCVSCYLSTWKWWIVRTIRLSRKWIPKNEPARKVRSPHCRSRDHINLIPLNYWVE